jgi:hypothetical protein
VRQAESLPVVAALRDWLDRALAAVVPQSLTGKAVAYLDSQWPKLVRVFGYGFVPLAPHRRGSLSAYGSTRTRSPTGRSWTSSATRWP